MFAIEMWEESGSWNVERWGNKKHCRGCDPRDGSKVHLHHTEYEWQSGSGRWVQLGGRYASVEEADEAIARFQQCGSWKKPREFRVLRE